MKTGDDKQYPRQKTIFPFLNTSLEEWLSFQNSLEIGSFERITYSIAGFPQEKEKNILFPTCTLCNQQIH